MTRDQSLSALSALLVEMNSDELQVLARFARKIVNGSIKHGPMNLDTDTRDLGGKEIRDELMDAACYRVMDEIRTERRAVAVPRTRTPSSDPIVEGLRELAENAPEFPDAVEYMP